MVKYGMVLGCVSIGALMHAGTAYAQTATGNPARIQEIVVTAQKRGESAQKVPMSITAVTGKELATQGVRNPADLTLVVPGLTYTDSDRGTPVYGIRGISFNDVTLGVDSAVALYTDEVPLAFPVEARFAAMDLERVEVLKGPQGTLFGQNSTGGAINFIAAKPSSTPGAGATLNYGNFNTVSFDGFVTGPATDTLNARMAVSGTRSDGWQESYTRNASLGRQRKIGFRTIFDWTPTDRLKLTLNVNGWYDGSDTLAGQLVASDLLFKSASPIYSSFYPRAPHNAQAADWDPGRNFNRDDRFLQGSLRVDYKLSDAIKITSITALTRFNQNFTQDDDGTAFQGQVIQSVGSIRSISQELRAAADLNRLKMIVGVDYSHDNAKDDQFYNFADASPHIVQGFYKISGYTDQSVNNYAVFGNADYKLTDKVKLHGGLRYTVDNRNSAACSRDGDGVISALFNSIIAAVGAPPANLQPGDCVTFNPGFKPGVVYGKLDEHNISFRAGADWSPSSNLLAYFNISKGYKAGSFPAVNASTYAQYAPVKQESVLAYEAGFKSYLFDRTVQLNGAAFYYQYHDKQIRGSIVDPLGIFGVLQALVTIPRSRIAGGEINATWQPLRGLKFDVGATFVDSKVTKNDIGFDPFGNLINFKGLSFPDTPKWNVNADANYDWSLNSNFRAFANVNMNYVSSTSAAFNNEDVTGSVVADPTNLPGVTLPRDIMKIRAHTVVGARLGFGPKDGKWEASVWGKNIFNTYYWTSVVYSIDTIYRLPAMPATYGVTLAVKF